MHELQKKLLDVAQLEDLSRLTYRQIGERIGCRYASQVVHHLGQLEKHGFLVRSATGKFSVESSGLRPGDGMSLRIPVLGEADCGEATQFATNNIVGYLTVSPSLIHDRDVSDMYALIARGNSMNRAQINNQPIEDGDYVLVRKRNTMQLNNRDYVVSVIDNLANIKRFYRDETNRRIVLMPESSEQYQPIIIAEDDLENYHPAGVVVEVIKGTGHLA